MWIPWMFRGIRCPASCKKVLSASTRFASAVEIGVFRNTRMPIRIHVVNGGSVGYCVYIYIYI